MSWTPERVEALTKMRADGLSANQMAKALGGVTRNAVIGKVARMDLGPIGGAKASRPARVAMVKPPAEKHPWKAAVAPPPARPKALNGTPWTPAVIPNTPAPPTFVAPVGAWKPLPGCEPRPLAGLKFGLCRWPVGPAEGAEQLFCCRAVGDREAKGMAALYCTEHHARAVSATDFRKTKDLVRSLRHAIR